MMKNKNKYKFNVIKILKKYLSVLQNLQSEHQISNQIIKLLKIENIYQLILIIDYNFLFLNKIIDNKSKLIELQNDWSNKKLHILKKFNIRDSLCYMSKKYGNKSLPLFYPAKSLPLLHLEYLGFNVSDKNILNLINFIATNNLCVTIYDITLKNLSKNDTFSQITLKTYKIYIFPMLYLIFRMLYIIYVCNNNDFVAIFEYFFGNYNGLQNNFNFIGTKR